MFSTFSSQVASFALLASLLAVEAIDAAEVRMKPQARCSTSIVTLGDVAEVFAADEFQKQQLEGIELGTAPTAGSRRFLRAREVQDALWMRGINLSLHQFSGTERTEVSSAGEPDVSRRPLQATMQQRQHAERFVAEAILHSLQAAAGNREPFQVKVVLGEAQIQTALTYGGRLQAQGGTAPFVGKQHFTLQADDAASRIEIDAEVGLPPGVVVVQKSLPAGSIVHAGDITLKSVTGVNPGVQPFHRLEDVVGQQTTWSIPAGTILSRNGLQRPQVVRRGDAVTLYARSAGLRVRTTVRAREAGGVGDLITVESLSDRAPFFARVTGVQEAEVYAEPATAAPTVPAATVAVEAAADKFDAAQGGVVR